MLPALGKLGRIVGRSLTFVGSLALKLGSVRRVLLMAAVAVTVVILGSLLLVVILAQG